MPITKLYYSPTHDYYMGHLVYLTDRKVRAKVTRTSSEGAKTKQVWEDETYVGEAGELLQNNEKNANFLINDNSTPQQIKEAILWNNKIINRIRGDCN